MEERTSKAQAIHRLPPLQTLGPTTLPTWSMSWTQSVCTRSLTYAYAMLTRTDPEVQTLTSITNIQNSLFIPNLGRFVNRRPTYNLQRAPSERESLEDINRILAPAQQGQETSPPSLQRSQTGGTMATLATIDSHLSESRYAVLPHGTTLDDWSKEDKKELNDHVRHMLHSRRSRFKRSLRGFGQYVRRRKHTIVPYYNVG